MNAIEEIEKLVKLRDRGVLTEEEFQELKAETLGMEKSSASIKTDNPKKETKIETAAVVTDDPLSEVEFQESEPETFGTEEPGTSAENEVSTTLKNINTGQQSVFTNISIEKSSLFKNTWVKALFALMAVIAFISIGIWGARQNNESTANTVSENTTTKSSLASSSPGDCLQLSDATELVLENNEPKDIHPSDYKKKICFFENKVISEIVESDGEYVQEEFVKWDKVYKRFLVTRGEVELIVTLDDVNQGISQTSVFKNDFTHNLSFDHPHVIIFKKIEKIQEALKPQSEVKFLASNNVVGLIDGAEKYLSKQQLPDKNSTIDSSNNSALTEKASDQKLPIEAIQVPKAAENTEPPPKQVAEAQTESVAQPDTNNDLIQYASDATPFVLDMIESARDTDKLLAAKNSLEGLGKPTKGDRKAARKLNDTAIALMGEKKYTEAIPILEDAHKTDPADIEIMNNLAYAYIEKGIVENDFAKAKQSLVDTLHLKPERAQAWANLGRTFSLEGNESAASNC
jgi:tetratricopeptide (TPR) repeat protein